MDYLTFDTIAKAIMKTIAKIINIEIGFAKLSVKPNPVLFGRNILESVGL